MKADTKPNTCKLNPAVVSDIVLFKQTLGRFLNNDDFYSLQLQPLIERRFDQDLAEITLCYRVTDTKSAEEFAEAVIRRASKRYLDTALDLLEVVVKPQEDERTLKPLPLLSTPTGKHRLYKYCSVFKVADMHINCTDAMIDKAVVHVILYPSAVVKLKGGNCSRVGLTNALLPLFQLYAVKEFRLFEAEVKVAELETAKASKPSAKPTFVDNIGGFFDPTPGSELYWERERDKVATAQRKAAEKLIPKHTYIARNPLSGLLKIGKTKNVKTRLANLSSGNGCKIELVKWWDRDLESELHQRFAAYRKSPEWFEDAQEIRDFFLKDTEGFWTLPAKQAA